MDIGALKEQIQVLEDALIKAQSRARNTEVEKLEIELEYKNLRKKFQNYKEKVNKLLNIMENEEKKDFHDRIENIEEKIEQSTKELNESREILLEESEKHFTLSQRITSLVHKIEILLNGFISTIFRFLRICYESLVTFIFMENQEDEDEKNFEILM